MGHQLCSHLVTRNGNLWRMRAFDEALLLRVFKVCVGAVEVARAETR